jgi:hypothetical protein
MRFLAIKDEARREGTPDLAQVLHGSLPALIAADIEGSFARDPNLYVVAFLQLKRFDDRGGQTNRQAVSPTSRLA